MLANIVVVDDEWNLVPDAFYLAHAYCLFSFVVRAQFIYHPPSEFDALNVTWCMPLRPRVCCSRFVPPCAFMFTLSAPPCGFEFYLFHVSVCVPCLPWCSHLRMMILQKTVLVDVRTRRKGRIGEKSYWLTRCIADCDSQPHSRCCLASEGFTYRLLYRIALPNFDLPRYPRYLFRLIASSFYTQTHQHFYCFYYSTGTLFDVAWTRSASFRVSHNWNAFLLCADQLRSRHYRKRRCVAGCFRISQSDGKMDLKHRILVWEMFAGFYIM